MSRILHYALGAGLGHVTRQLALARRAVARGHSSEILCSGPLSRFVIESNFARDVSFNHLGDSPTADEVREHIPTQLSSSDFDLLIVDTFPRGLAGELAGVVPSPRALVHRAITEEYCSREDVSHAAGSYDIILCPGESGQFSHFARTHWTAPWLTLRPEERLARVAARKVLGATHEITIAVLGTGTLSEIECMSHLAEELHTQFGDRANVRWLAPGDGHPWPLLRYLSGVDVLVGAGGYNTVHEARDVGIQLFAWARKRRYDRQDQRLRPDERIHSSEELLSRLEALLKLTLTQREFSQRRASLSNDGATEALDILESTGLLSSRHSGGKAEAQE